MRTNAGGEPVAKEMIRKFKVKAARAPDDTQPDANDAVPDPPDDAAQPAAAAAAQPAAAPEPATPPAKRGKPAGSRSRK